MKHSRLVVSFPCSPFVGLIRLHALLSSRRSCRTIAANHEVSLYVCTYSSILQTTRNSVENGTEYVLAIDADVLLCLKHFKAYRLHYLSPGFTFKFFLSSSSSSSSSSSCSLLLDPQDEVGPSISSSVVQCFFVLLVYIVVIALVVCLCPSSVRALATFPGTVLLPTILHFT